MSRGRPGPDPAAEATRPSAGLAPAYAALSALLRYPDEALLRDLPVLRSAIAQAPSGIRDQVDVVIRWLAATSLLEAQAHYVATFDMRRKCCLYLSYYLNGDTRRRGEALWRFQDACRRAGFRNQSGELPDYLPLLLELAASGGEREAVALIEEHRAGIALLQRALSQAGSPYAGLVRALQALLPAALPGMAARAARLMAEGPPTELVGAESAAALSPYQPGAPGPDGSERQ